MKSELISVIVPVYNVEKYLGKCVESLIHQTYTNIEILLIDDGSTDSSGEMCEQYAKTDDRIKVYHKKNTGLGLSRNYGLDRITGEYVVFVDSDDYVSLDMIEVFWKEHLRTGCDTIIAGFQAVADDGGIIYQESYSSEVFVDQSIRNQMLPRMIGSLPGKRDSIFKTVWAIMYSAEVIKKASLNFFSEREMQGEDIPFQLDYFQYSEKTSVISDMIYFYRYNPKSLSRKYKPNRFEESKKVYHYIEQFIRDSAMPKEANLRLSKMFFVQIRSALKQEQPIINNQSLRSCLKNIKEICSDQLVMEVIAGYPTKALDFKQKLFIVLIKNKLSLMLFIALKMIN